MGAPRLARSICTEQRVRPILLLRWCLGALVLLGCQSLFAPSPKDSPEPAYCTAYNHLVKSGGTSIKDQLLTSSLIENSRPPGLCTSDGSTTAGACHEALHNSSIIMGYSELLRYSLREKGRECQWFTMMRHPIDQLVSAFYYCPEHDLQRRPSKYCGNIDIPGERLETRLVDFARHHWTNMIYRQMLHSMFCQPHFDLCPAEHARYKDDRPFNLNTKESRDVLRKIQELMLTYTAIGIFSQWELSMDLFDAVIVSPVRRWNHRLAQNQGLKSAERESLLSWAYLDPELHEILAADLLLYNFGVFIFQHQTSEVLGTVWQK